MLVAQTSKGAARPYPRGLVVLAEEAYYWVRLLGKDSEPLQDALQLIISQMLSCA